MTPAYTSPTTPIPPPPRMWKLQRLRPLAARPLMAQGRQLQLAFLASVRPQLSSTWFDSTPPPENNTPPVPKPVDERTLNMGRTIKVLQDRMPTLLQSPLPSEILSPSINLILFPSTHPNLPTVRGRVAYIAALWTTPVAWGRLPSRNLRLQVLSERMIKASPGCSEKLIVKWRTSSKEDLEERGAKEIKVQGGTTAVDDGEFCGLFLFEFDELGRVQTHTIENADENLGGDHTSSVITVTEWLLRKAKGQEEVPGGLAWQCERGG